jgi:hypothetical protein
MNGRIFFQKRRILHNENYKKLSMVAHPNTPEPEAGETGFKLKVHLDNIVRKEWRKKEQNYKIVI